MKVYSDVFTERDMCDAAQALSLEVEYTTIRRPRVRSRGWNVSLIDPHGRRRKNSGTHGAGEPGAASYTQHGHWMALLYNIDPRATIAFYKSAENFHQTTKDQFRV